MIAMNSLPGHAPILSLSPGKTILPTTPLQDTLYNDSNILHSSSKQNTKNKYEYLVTWD